MGTRHNNLSESKYSRMCYFITFTLSIISEVKSNEILNYLVSYITLLNIKCVNAIQFGQYVDKLERMTYSLYNHVYTANTEPRHIIILLCMKGIKK